MMRWAIPLAALALLAGCTKTTRWDGPAPEPAARPGSPVIDEPGQPPRGARGNPAFYEVFGRRYYVMPTSAGYLQKGVASWYGQKFHGKPTSSGEPYDMHAMTAAHKTLPLPTRVRVTNLQNRRSVVVTVNDRGPFIDNRLIDMSYAAARQLGMIRDGTAMVEVEALPYDAPEREPVVSAAPVPSMVAAAAAPPPEDPVLYLQLGAFGEPANAERLKARLETGGFGDVLIHLDTTGDQRLYRVRLGPIKDVSAYDRLVERVAALDIQDFHLVTARPGG
jgi:rare lipoprotein A